MKFPATRASKSAAKFWVGQQRLGFRLGVQDRQVRRAVGALVELGLLRVEREGGRGNTNSMVALIYGRRLFEPGVADHGSSTSESNGTRMSL